MAADEVGSKAGGSGNTGSRAPEGRTPAPAADAGEKKGLADKGTGKGNPAGGAKKAGAASPPRAPRARVAGPDLGGDLRQFVAEHPHGWGHNEWLALLHHLQERGHGIDNVEQIGGHLERERLSTVLQQVPGVGPQRIKSIAERYGSVWNLRHANVDELAESAKIPRSLAQRIKEQL